MQQDTQYLTTSNSTEAVKFINKTRLSKKNKWYYIHLNYNGKIYQIKAYNTWLQIFRSSEGNFSNCMDSGISAYKSHILETLEA